MTNYTIYPDRRLAHCVRMRAYDAVAVALARGELPWNTDTSVTLPCEGARIRTLKAGMEKHGFEVRALYSEKAFDDKIWVDAGGVQHLTSAFESRLRLSGLTVNTNALGAAKIMVAHGAPCDDLFISGVVARGLPEIDIDFGLVIALYGLPIVGDAFEVSECAYWSPRTRVKERMFAGVYKCADGKIITRVRATRHALRRAMTPLIEDEKRRADREAIVNVSIRQHAR